MVEAWIAIIVKIEGNLLTLRTDTGVLIVLLQPPLSFLKSVLKPIRRGYRVGDVVRVSGSVIAASEGKITLECLEISEPAGLEIWEIL